MSDEKHKPWCSEWARKENGGCICKASSSLAPAPCSASGYRSVTLLASEHSNLAEYLGQLERERDDMLAFIREQIELWDNDGDSGFPLYEHGKRILARYPPPNEKS